MNREATFNLKDMIRQGGLSKSVAGEPTVAPGVMQNGESALRGGGQGALPPTPSPKTPPPTPAMAVDYAKSQ